MRLSEHFTLAEMEFSATAVRRGLVNRAPPEAVEALRRLVGAVLQPLRAYFGPVRVLSGYRSPELNRLVRGSRTSQHMLGEAADVRVPGRSTLEVAQYIRDRLPFDQLILEYYTPGVPESGWVHVSYREGRLRRQVLTKVPGERGYRTGLIG